MINNKINFSKLFKTANILSIIAVLASIFFLFFKGLNFGVDFKGGTLIEIRIVDQNIKISDVRSSFSQINLGDVNVKEFGRKGDYLIKVEQKTNENAKLIPLLKETIKKNLNTDVILEELKM